MITVFITVLSGVLVFVFGQIFVKFLIEPIHEQDKCIGEIIDALIFYANLYTNPAKYEILSSDQKKEREKGSDHIRQLASKLNAKNQQIRCYKIFALLKFVPKRDSVIETSKSLIGISNSFFSVDSKDALYYRDDIEKRLGVSIFKSKH